MRFKAATAVATLARSGTMERAQAESTVSTLCFRRPSG
jgi:hypothetical protein